MGKIQIHAKFAKKITKKVDKAKYCVYNGGQGYMAMESFYHRAQKAVHYICAACPDSSTLGIVKLNKILWYADISAYRYTGKSITGLSYIKQPRGPVPRNIREILEAMEKEGLIQTSRQSVGAKAWLFQSRQDPDRGVFSREEIGVLDAVITEIRDNHTAQSISDLSHNWAWEIANMGEEIPISTCLIEGAVMPDSEDKEWADQALTRL